MTTQAPWEPVARSGVAARSQSLKSPTNETACASGAYSTNDTAFWGEAEPGCGRSLIPANVAPTATAASTAARASRPSGVMLMVRGRSSHTCRRRG